MKHDMLRRFAFIEARLLWAGGLTANELAAAFGIARQNAQQTISAYAKQHPGQLEHSTRQRRQVPTDGFKALYVREDVCRFLDYQRAASYTARFHDEPDWADLPFTDADAFARPLYDQHAARTALTALRRQAVVLIGYWAMSGARTRRISPHHLVHADARYHLRAFCHETQQFLDFNLARIVNAELSKEDWVSAANDTHWHERVDLEFEINPQLPSEAQAALRQDHVRAGETTMKVRGVRRAIAYYVKRRFARIDERYDMRLWWPVPRELGTN
ncbi:WYL domain-containing protein [uncultured Thiohalocapsa sp.]|uniref:WYL domain-containing protein n=1 Tax=uncultured Thiohalocapsa sp. TaxID=768990 RepID=UPI0025DB6831|nr:WYL domain-containing protein [uncultured Thiohalocapsa sp.]